MLNTTIKAMPKTAKATVVAALLAASMQAQATTSPAMQLEAALYAYAEWCLAFSDNHAGDEEILDCIDAAAEMGVDIADEMKDLIEEASQ